MQVGLRKIPGGKRYQARTCLGFPCAEVFPLCESFKNVANRHWWPHALNQAGPRSGFGLIELLGRVRRASHPAWRTIRAAAPERKAPPLQCGTRVTGQMARPKEQIAPTGEL